MKNLFFLLLLHLLFLDLFYKSMNNRIPGKGSAHSKFPISFQ